MHFNSIFKPTEMVIKYSIKINFAISTHYDNMPWIGRVVQLFSQEACMGEGVSPKRHVSASESL